MAENTNGSNTYGKCYQSADLIINGGFEQNQCFSDWCGWHKSNFQPEIVPGWTPQPEIEVGIGFDYTKVFRNSWVS